MNPFSFLSDPANWMGAEGIPARLGEHLVYTIISIVVAAVIAVPIGILVGHSGRGEFAVLGSSNAARAIPTLGFLVLMVILMGTDLVPVLIPLVVLSLPPILTASAAGVRGADENAVHAARALGMTPLQVITKVEWPLALPLIISGVRSATLQVVATATVAAFVAAGGLGRFVVDGQQRGLTGYPEMFAGAILVAVLAIVLDGILGGIGWLLSRRSRPSGRSTRATIPEQSTDEIELPAGARS